MTSQTSNIQAVDQSEVHERSMQLADVSPGIIPFLEDEVVRLEEESRKFQSGELDNAEFTPYRLRQGVYGQRQPDVQMIRVKLPGGILTAQALRAFGDITERYAPLRKGHVTTRENIQMHHIPLEDCPEVLHLLGEVGLSTREACGNTVRNVVGPPTAGVCADEVFDPTPYLAAYVRFGVRHPITQNFPRKFKTAFSGSDTHDNVSAAIQDLTYVAQVRHENGSVKRGFKVFVGGGTSIMPRLAKPLYEFVPEEDYLRVALAIWTVFNNADMLRKNRMMARIKVMIDRIGLDAFRELVDAELDNIGPIDPKPLMQLDELQRETPPAPDASASSNLTSNGAGGGRGNPTGRRRIRPVERDQRCSPEAGRVLPGLREADPRRHKPHSIPGLGRYSGAFHRRPCPHHPRAEPGPPVGARKTSARPVGGPSRHRPGGTGRQHASPTSFPAPGPTVASWESPRLWVWPRPSRRK